MKLSNRISWVILILIIVALFARMMVVKVEIGTTGVLTKEWGGGLVEKDFGPGFHWDLGPLHTWVLFDTTVQSLHFNSNNNTRQGRGRDIGEGPLQVKSAEGSTVTLDVTVKFRIQPGQTWALRRDMGVGDSYKVKVRNEAIDALRPVFGRMDNEEFYEVESREKRAGEAEKILAERLKKLHVDLIAILIRDVSFDREYEARIRAKTQSQQKELLNKSETELRMFEGETNEVKAQSTAMVTVINQNLERQKRELTAENEKKIAKIRADSEKYALEQRADADLYAAEKKAGGQLLIENAKAEAQRMRQGALQGSGAANLIALEAAKNLRIETLEVSTLQTNFLDLLELAKRLGAEGDKKPKSEDM
jgi:regulator of protease activity HflC (stomatin/prohibitin superfamily)